MRQYKRRIDALLEAERERLMPLPAPPPPINGEHAALRRQIAELYRILLDDPEKPESIDKLEWFEERFHERVKENPELDNVADEYIDLVDTEVELLAKNGIDYGPYDNYEFE
jgi:hypothetical protein